MRDEQFRIFIIWIATIATAIFLFSQIRANAVETTYTLNPLCGFSNTQNETSIAVNPAVGVVLGNPAGPAVGVTTSTKTQTVDRYYIVCKDESEFYLVTLKDYSSWLLICNSESFDITDKSFLFGSLHTTKFKDKLADIEAITKEEADAYVLACTREGVSK